jgi:hypothetical protein
MDLTIVGKLINPVTNDIFGYQISAGGAYTICVTEEKAKELNVQDIDIAQYLDVNEIEAVPIGTNKYGVVSNSSAFFEDFATEPRGLFGDKDLYYGYYFKDSSRVSINSDVALNRMIAEKQGGFV